MRTKLALLFGALTASFLIIGDDRFIYYFLISGLLFVFFMGTLVGNKNE